MKAPCKGCPDRTTGENRKPCHMTCEKYAAFKASKDKANARRREESDSLDAIITSKMHMVKNSDKKKRR